MLGQTGTQDASVDAREEYGGTKTGVGDAVYFDAISIKVEDDHSILETRKKDGKVIQTSKLTVSPDGTTAIFEFADSSDSTAEPVVGKGTMVRVGKGKRPASAHAISGSWRISKLESLSDNALSITLTIQDETLKMRSPTGQAYAAKLDGADACWWRIPENHAAVGV